MAPIGSCCPVVRVVSHGEEIFILLILWLPELRCAEMWDIMTGLVSESPVRA